MRCSRIRENSNVSRLLNFARVKNNQPVFGRNKLQNGKSFPASPTVKTWHFVETWDKTGVSFKNAMGNFRYDTEFGTELTSDSNPVLP
jgi:hypothetical protein